MAAVGLFPTDLNNREIGRRLKICDQTVSRWRAQYRAGGESALRKAGRAGRKPLLNTADQKRLVELLEKGPERLGYETPLWTCDRVADLIAQEFEVSYHAGHVWKILRQLNWSVQRPAGRALERDEAGIQRWKSERWPEIKKKRKQKAARSSSSTRPRAGTSNRRRPPCRTPSRRPSAGGQAGRASARDGRPGCHPSRSWPHSPVQHAAEGQRARLHVEHDSLLGVDVDARALAAGDAPARFSLDEVHAIGKSTDQRRSATVRAA